MSEIDPDRPCWFVGASYGAGSDDQTARFLEEGSWENGYTDKYLDEVRAIKPGDRIAIKAAYVRKHGLPFDGRGHRASVMGIKATGTVLENMDDGRRLKVDWTQVEPKREWYFFTGRVTVWRVMPGDWMRDALIAFTFHGAEQDLDRFRNEPYWRERFGDIAPEDERFVWTKFYQAVADKLVDHADDRSALLAHLHTMAAGSNALNILNDRASEGGDLFPLEDICPFTTMGIFNRQIKLENRRELAQNLAGFLGVDEPVPKTFEGIPVLNNQRSWLFGYRFRRKPNDIDNLWAIFREALSFADAGDDQDTTAFAKRYDEVVAQYSVGWTLTMGLYWIRPWFFPTLETQTRAYVENRLELSIPKNGPDKRCSGHDYLYVKNLLERRFEEEEFPVHSFPDLSREAYRAGNTVAAETAGVNSDNQEDEQPAADAPAAPSLPAYTIADILSDGCFLPHDELKRIVERLKTKKNAILQGPPGTGKTWLAKRLAFVLMGMRDESKLRAMQFHPNLSYEDFVRGWRPDSTGGLALVDGPLLRLADRARQDPDNAYVVVIEEINRGNPAQVFGEMLTLLEADKRTPAEGLRLSYQREGAPNERVWLPGNLYVIGTMNVADRSLALVDLALRRRFAFIDLVPQIGAPWRKWLNEKHGVDLDLLDAIAARVNALNETIAASPGLGPQFRIGHSYVTPPHKHEVQDPVVWYRQVVHTEIGPLLDEYWYDAPDRAQEARQTLVEGL